MNSNVKVAERKEDNNQVPNGFLVPEITFESDNLTDCFAAVAEFVAKQEKMLKTCPEGESVFDNPEYRGCPQYIEYEMCDEDLKTRIKLILC